ncbi:unnamed protein product [Caenorhabditis angaria]|uniref:Uncharacterized protein n=1 Tax=Caenorhabditis angaria TaxID=860376 RepID=A0A9P1N8Q9_9PELO|nr:unnamed protein product [Caenorhabditis angaria]
MSGNKRQRTEEVASDSEHDSPTHPSSKRANSSNTDLVVRTPLNDAKLTQFVLETGESEAPRYCLVPCPCRHASSCFRFHISLDGNTRILCNCSKLVPLHCNRKFKKFTKEQYCKNWDRIDLKPYRLELLQNVKNHDPTLHTPLFVPHGMKSNEVEQPFYGDHSFQPCSNNHEGKDVLLMHVRGGNIIIVCKCQDELCYKYKKKFDDNLLSYLKQTTVFKYSSPKTRGFTAVPNLGFIVI